MVAVREDAVLLRQEGAAAIDEVEAGQPVLLGDLLARADACFTVSAKKEPPFTVASLAISMQARPATTPMPVTMPAPGTSAP